MCTKRKKQNKNYNYNTSPIYNIVKIKKKDSISRQLQVNLIRVTHLYSNKINNWNDLYESTGIGNTKVLF